MLFLPKTFPSNIAVYCSCPLNSGGVANTSFKKSNLNPALKLAILFKGKCGAKINILNITPELTRTYSAPLHKSG